VSHPGGPGGPRPVAVAPRPLSELAALLDVPVPAGGAGVPGGGLVSGVTHDSRAVRPGDLYAALPGHRHHGARFADQAVAAGAVAVLTDAAGRGLLAAAAAAVPVLVVPDPRAVLGRVAARVYGDPAADLLLLGVTGTNGKTTTAYLLEAGLRAAGHCTGLLGTVETRLAGQTLPSARTTPEAADLQALLAVLRERGGTAAALEVSSHALALGRVGGLRVDVAAFTNLSQDHLDFHADLEDYFAAKARLFTPEHTAHGVVNVDDPYGRRLVAQAPVPLTTCSPGGARPADWVVRDLRRGPDGVAFTASGPPGEIPVDLRLVGSFNVANALLALASLVAAGVAPDAAADGLAGLPGVPGRMERVDAGQPFLALVDYAHTPEAVRTLLTTLRETTTGRLLVVLGCGGDRDQSKRPAMGAAAAALADVAVLTSDNPRSEDPAAILAAMRAGAGEVPAADRAEIQVEPDRGRAIARAVALAGPGDTLVVAGRGHEPEQEVAGRLLPFDDREVLRETLRAVHGSGAAGGRG